MLYSVRRVDLVPYWGTQFDDLPQSFLDNQLTEPFESSPSTYNEFIHYYGTHFFKNALVSRFSFVRSRLHSASNMTVIPLSLKTMESLHFGATALFSIRLLSLAHRSVVAALRSVHTERLRYGHRNVEGWHLWSSKVPPVNVTVTVA